MRRESFKKEARMKKKWFLAALAILWIIAWIWIMDASRHSSCDAAGPVTQRSGLCLGRSLAEMSCFAGYLVAWTYMGGVLAKAKGGRQAIGWVLGFFFQFAGCIAILIWKPKGKLCPRCGKREISGERGLCEDCFLGRTPS